MRGLFLRHYLSQVSKDKLPDTGSEYEGYGDNTDTQIDTDVDTAPKSHICERAIHHLIPSSVLCVCLLISPPLISS